MKTEEPKQRPVNWTLWIMVAVLVWGGYLAIGASQARGNHANWRGLIIFGCTLAFLGFWWLALTLRARRIDASESEEKS